MTFQYQSTLQLEVDPPLPLHEEHNDLYQELEASRTGSFGSGVHLSVKVEPSHLYRLA